MKEIPLSKGQVALVDDADYERLSQFSWHARKSQLTFYAETNISDANGRRSVGMHRIILGLIKGQQTDHIDLNGLNNQRSNLRICTSSQNAQHRRGYNRYGYRGVTPKDSGWRAKVKANGKEFKSPTVRTIIDAAIEYDKLAKRHFGEFALLNFPDGEQAVAVLRRNQISS